jgi:hypothetical protein
VKKISYDLISLTTEEKNKVISLLDKNSIQRDRLLFSSIRELNSLLKVLDKFYSKENFEDDRNSIRRDNVRIKKILALINEIEFEPVKTDLRDSIPEAYQRPIVLPRVDEERRHIVKSCATVANLLLSRGYFKRAKEKELYPFLASLANILRPHSFNSDELNDGEIKSFKKFLES